jgi:hypothetical protein
MGCVASKLDINDVHPNMFSVLNVDEVSFPVKIGVKHYLPLTLFYTAFLCVKSVLYPDPAGHFRFGTDSGSGFL